MARSRKTRREALVMLGATGVALAAGCGSETAASPTTVASPATGGTPGACAVSPSETIGPFPSLADFVRSDIREGRPGTPVTLNITVVNASSGCSAVGGAVVDVWQTDAAGRYSQYAQGGYDGRGETFSGAYASRGPNPTSNARDGIFADSLASELATVTGGVAGGYTAAFTVGVAL